MIRRSHHPRLISPRVVAAMIALLGWFWLPSAKAESDVDFFEKRIRPIFVDRCEKCHSEAKAKTSGGLALDTRDGWLKGGDNGPVLTPGKPNESLLIHAVRYSDDGPQMPPSEAGGKLSNAEIASLVEWVARGAPDPRKAEARIGGMTADEARRWWSFQKVRSVRPPVARRADWPRTDVDPFVLAEMEKHSLSPSPPADRRTLLRRATFDLTGLPPTPEQMDAFLADTSSDAFARVVDRLLDSPAYGERWARFWLDLVRYADFYDANPATRTASCELTEAWRYRDWVVAALNRDMPFDQFIVHQIAGDLLPSPNGDEVYADGLVATTFLSNGVWDRGDADKEKIVSDMVDDNIDVIGKTFLGLTFGCARCHDHKFDPVTTADYYAMAGIFYSTHILAELGAKGGEYTMNRVPLAPKAVVARRAEQEKQLAEAEARIKEFDERRPYLNLVADAKALTPTEFTSASGAKGTIAKDGSVLVAGPAGKDTYTVKAATPVGSEVKYVCVEALTDPSLPKKGPGRAANGGFVMTNFAMSFAEPGVAAALTPVKLTAAKASFEEKDFAAAKAIDDNPESGWAVKSAVGKDHVAVFEIAPGSSLPAGALCQFTIEQKHSSGEKLGRFRLSVLNHFPSGSPANDSKRQGLVDRRDQLRKEMIPPLPLAISVQEGGTAGGLFPSVQDVPIHIRGSYTRLGPVVKRRLPLFLAGEKQPPISSGSGRRELAAWVASQDNPLVARVIVNRIWQWHFGAGIVRTPSNFGKLGEPPTHPELLDYLAKTFIEQGWSIKKLHRRIMLSATYQQSSATDREGREKDPDNRWLSRFSARRLEAEAIRDAMLSVAEQLDRTPGGPAGDDLNISRRSLYVQTARWDRGSYAMLFDAANPDASTDQRTVSTVAPQALFLLNHQFAVAQAKRLAERLLREVPTDESARVRRAYVLLFGRPPLPEEVDVAREFMGEPKKADSLAVWTDYAHLLLCSNEFVFLD